MHPHLTADDLEYVADGDARAEINRHLADCAICRARAASTAHLSAALHAIPRAPLPRDLAARITATVETRVAQESSRRARASFTAVATFLSALLVVWFAFETAAALQDNSTLEYITWISTHPELFAAHFGDTLFALFEIIPISETLLTLFALFTVGVLAQQWITTVRSPSALARQAGFD